MSETALGEGDLEELCLDLESVGEAESKELGLEQLPVASLSDSDRLTSLKFLTLICVPLIVAGLFVTCRGMQDVSCGLGVMGGLSISTSGSWSDSSGVPSRALSTDLDRDARVLSARSSPCVSFDSEPVL